MYLLLLDALQLGALAQQPILNDFVSWCAVECFESEPPCCIGLQHNVTFSCRGPTNNDNVTCMGDFDEPAAPDIAHCINDVCTDNRECTVIHVITQAFAGSSATRR
jgi:hypothetical protein